jgi:hypothetical protein
MNRVPQATPRRLLPLLTFFAAQAAVWVLLGFAFAGLLVLAGPFEWPAALGISAVNWLPWAALTPVIFWLSKLFPLERGRLLRSVPVHIVAGLLCTALCLWITASVFPFPLVRPGPRGGPAPVFRDLGPGGAPDRAMWPHRFDNPSAQPGADNRMTRDPATGQLRRRFPDERFGRGGPDGAFPRRTPDASLARNELRRDFFALFGPFAARGNFGFSIYLIVMAAAHALAFYRRAQERDRHALELAASLNRAKLDALRLQLQPHFLFNTLNAIATLVHRDARAADELIGDLSDLLRLSLLTTDHEVPLGRELELLDRYLAIEQARLGSRLRIAREIDSAATAALVPTFVLQPLAENAIRHGLEPRQSPGTITVSARRDGDTLRLTVADDGVGLAADQLTSRRGIGLANTEARLQALHGPAAKLELHTPPEGGLRVELTLPFRTAPAPETRAEPAAPTA